MKYRIDFMDFMRFQPIRFKDFILHLPTVDRQECPYFDPMSKNGLVVLLVPYSVKSKVDGHW